MRAELRGKRDALLSRIGIRPVVMGILNVTPDSFSDGGLFQARDAAIASTSAASRRGPAPIQSPMPTSSPASSRS